MSDTNILTEEELGLLSDRHQAYYEWANLRLSCLPALNPYPAQMVVELCYELAQARLEVRRLRDETNRV